MKRFTILWEMNGVRYVSPRCFDTPEETEAGIENTRELAPKWRNADAKVMELVECKKEEEVFEI